MENNEVDYFFGKIKAHGKIGERIHILWAFFSIARGCLCRRGEFVELIPIKTKTIFDVDCKNCMKTIIYAHLLGNAKKGKNGE